MTTLDELDLFTVQTPANPAAAPKRCTRHEWFAAVSGAHVVASASRTMGHSVVLPEAHWECRRCGRIKDEAASRRGRNARARGNQLERDWCHRLGLRLTGKFGGPDDGTNELFVGQAKSKSSAAYPGWMSDELAKLPRTGGRIPILGILEAPGSGHKPRRLVVLEEADFIALHGGTAE
ncbi:MAG: hypothetical protein ACRDGQ_15130 [Candidatus Limnocylindrales bacterium]